MPPKRVLCVSPDKQRAEVICDQAAEPVDPQFAQEALGEEQLVWRVVKRPQGWQCEGWSRDDLLQENADVSFP